MLCCLILRALQLLLTRVLRLIVVNEQTELSITNRLYTEDPEGIEVGEISLPFTHFSVDKGSTAVQLLQLLVTLKVFGFCYIKHDTFIGSIMTD